ncbi:MAG: hypothetical protein D6731_07460 [Planctomycetota bacterium]|nr:MAG: hypothetical protein D6731_07460 [Planctomycetota bacterium]
MAYRYSASGTLLLSPRHVERVCSALRAHGVAHRREGNAVLIEHEERASTPSTVRARAAFEEIAPFVDEPQSIQVNCELTGAVELGFVDGRLREDKAVNVWSQRSDVPTPDDIIDELRRRGIAARAHRLKGGRKSGRRSRVFEIQPGSGGPGCRVTVKRRFWDSYDLLSVPEVYEPLCQKYHMSSARLRDALKNATFGLEVRNPALRTASSDLVYDALVEVLEDITEGIRTDIG